MVSLNQTEKTATAVEKITAALMYGASSIGIMMLNKYLLTELKFPSFNLLGLVQYFASLVILLAQRATGSIDFPLSFSAVKEVFPLPFFFLGNTLSGLGATKQLNMPMFVLLRRFSIVMTMGLEMYLLGRTFKNQIHLSVVLMVFGALVAAAADFHYDTLGYVMILLNDLFTALQGVVLRRKMDDTRGKLSTHGLMFYNNLLSMPAAILLMVASPSERHEVASFEHWGDRKFQFVLFLSAIMGFVINYTYYLCTKLNSPLTTTVVGCLKNVLTSYVGMLFRDFTWTSTSNFVWKFTGINISVFGSLIYQHAEWRKIKELEQQRKKERDAAV